MKKGIAKYRAGNKLQNQVTISHLQALVTLDNLRASRGRADSAGRHAAHYACASGMMEYLSWYFETYPEEATAKCPKTGMTPLMAAVVLNRGEVVERMCK